MDSTGFYKAVVDDSGNSLGDSLCMSGSFSGTICGLVIRSGGTVNYDGRWFYAYQIYNPTGGPAGGRGLGDSSSSVFSLSGSTGVIAHGIFSAISGTRSGCVGVATTCSATGWFAPIQAVESTLGIVIGP